MFTISTITPLRRFPYVEKIGQGVGLQGEIKQSGKISSKSKERLE